MLAGSTTEQRRHYAVRMLQKAGVLEDGPLASAFSHVRREDFLGPPPWLIQEHGGYHESPSQDVATLYEDVLVALDAPRGVSNGSPSLHALALHSLAPKRGETVVHAGAGAGYYTAILAELVGPEGHILAIEYDTALAERARACLADRGNVEVVCGNAVEWPREDADIVYVNFAVDRPADPWIERLKPGGRLLFPLGVPHFECKGKGPEYTAMAGFLLVRREAPGYASRFIEGVSFVWGEGVARSDWACHTRLRAAFADNWRAVQSLRWKGVADEDEWYSEPDWGLSTHALAVAAAE
jgi:protein-L-isoaspartate(D-aspartate) O-methyltransferase